MPENRRTNAATTGSKSKETPKLSCEHCRVRKVKCDKLQPCTNCASSGAVCVPIQRPRLPRGRYAHRSHLTSPATVSLQTDVSVNEDLKERIRRLEALVGGMSSPVSNVGEACGCDREQSVEDLNMQTMPSSRTSPSSSAPPTYNLHLERPEHFYTNLVAEIRELRDVINSAPGEVDEDALQAPDHNSAQINSADGGVRALGLYGSSNLLPVQRLCHDKRISSQLCKIYLQQVDPIIKILHKPSLEKWMVQGGEYLGYPDSHSSTEALKTAVCYSAASSMTENQYRATFHSSKTTFVLDCRRACEDAIERSGLLTTQDITVLQAFVLYLIARRSDDRSRAVWTLIATAVRIAKSLGLYLDPDKDVGRNETFFDQQMRKRLWLTICLMDLQASFGQGSEPLCNREEVASSLATIRHINDSDFDPSTTQHVPDREGLTDSTFALVTYHAQLGGRLLNFAAHDDPSGGSLDNNRRNVMSSLDDFSGQEMRQEHARQFEKKALGLLHFCDPESSPYAWFTWHGTQSLVAGMRLSVLRPLRRREGSQAPQSSRIEGDTELLCLALKVLEKGQLINTDPRGEGFRWYIIIQTHALAIAIVECYVCTDESLVRRSWAVIEEAYQRYEFVTARYSGGMLRGPMAKLMRRTREKLAVLLYPTANQIFANASSSAQVSQEMIPGFTAAPNVNPAISNWPATISPSASDLSFSTPSQQIWNQPLISQPILTAPVSVTNQSPPQEVFDQSWRTWEEFVSGIPFDEFANSDFFFYENNFGSY